MAACVELTNQDLIRPREYLYGSGRTSGGLNHTSHHYIEWVKQIQINLLYNFLPIFPNLCLKWVVRRRTLVFVSVKSFPEKIPIFENGSLEILGGKCCIKSSLWVIKFKFYGTKLIEFGNLPLFTLSPHTYSSVNVNYFVACIFATLNHTNTKLNCAS